MANQAHPTTPAHPQQHDPANPPHVDPGAAPYTSYPGGMASDPVAALANEIVTNIKGAPDRLRSQIASTPALSSLMDQIEGNLHAEIAQSIRRLVESEVAKATGGLVPGKAAAANERDRVGAERRTA